MNKEGEGRTSCFHCGEPCTTDTIVSDDKTFCCVGCKSVYEILQGSDLCNYYEVENAPGISMKGDRFKRFEYLDKPEVIDKLVDFRNESLTKVQFYLPQIHCSACLWLLENLYKIQPRITESRVNFLKKEIYITFENEGFTLRQLVELLTSIGYEPSITLASVSDGKGKRKKVSRKLTYQVGLAGFAFGNIMLLSLPEYFGLDVWSGASFGKYFGWFNLFLAVPVTFYSGQDYFKSAYQSLRLGKLNIDVPISLGVAVLFVRSTYEVLAETGVGFFDSLCGLLFFLLLGRIFQQYIYHQLSFDRDYKAYFPVSLAVIKDGEEIATPIKDVKKGDRVFFRNGELIAVDGVLIDGLGSVDNSFATGESAPQAVSPGERVYAGGRQVGEGILVEVTASLNQSKLTRLWNDYADQEAHNATFSAITDKISAWFTPIILVVALGAGVLHYPEGWGAVIEVVSAVLIVACPCALALSAPFAFGHTIRWYGKQQFYLRDTGVIEALAKISHVVFDKTGTLTSGKTNLATFQGEPLNAIEASALWQLTRQSNHPISRLIHQGLPVQEIDKVFEYVEEPGVGVSGKVGDMLVALKAAREIDGVEEKVGASQTALLINGQLRGVFNVESTYRTGLKALVERWSKKVGMSMISGDNEQQKEALSNIFPKGTYLGFNCLPDDKLRYIKRKKEEGECVLMVGDGLNDAGALREANVGLSVADDINTFSPACDIIMQGSEFYRLDHLVQFAKKSRNVVYISFAISFLYNIVGLSFAVQGVLSPVVAAILMPVSSITVVAFVSAAIWLIGNAETSTSSRQA